MSLPFNPKPKGTVTLAATSASGSVLVRLDDSDGAQIYIINRGPNRAFIAGGPSDVAATVPSGGTAGSIEIPAGFAGIRTLAGKYIAAICASGETAALSFCPGSGGEGEAAVAGGSSAGSGPTAGATPIGFPAATFADKSGTITLGGTAQTFAAANTSRRGFLIQNQSAGNLYFSSLATAVATGQPSLILAPGETYETTPGNVSTGAISIIGATTGQAFAGREW